LCNHRQQDGRGRKISIDLFFLDFLTLPSTMINSEIGMEGDLPLNPPHHQQPAASSSRRRTMT
jgi:hypothetical protein